MTIDNGDIADWIKAGKIAAETMEFAGTIVKEGLKLVDLANELEKFIWSKGAKCAFPPNLSLNNIAAHYTPPPGDETTIKKGDILKVDIGVGINGAIGDHAKTFEIGTNKYAKQIEAAIASRDNAIKELKAGLEIRKIGQIVEKTMTSYGYTAVQNLSGHGLARYIIHTEPSIPNYDNKDKNVLEEGQIIAIEPFASNGSGYIKEGKGSTIFRLVKEQQVRDPTARKILDFIKSEFKTLPFSKLQVYNKFPSPTTNLAMNSLEKQGIIYQYAQLPEEEENCIVTQAEHTILIEKDGARILTKL